MNINNWFKDICKYEVVAETIEFRDPASHEEIIRDLDVLKTVE